MNEPRRVKSWGCLPNGTEVPVANGSMGRNREHTRTIGRNGWISQTIETSIFDSNRAKQ